MLQCKHVVHGVIERHIGIKDLVMALLARVEALESEKPGLPKGPPKKSVGLFGHKGRTLKMVDKADSVVAHHVHILKFSGESCRIKDFLTQLNNIDQF